MNKNLMLVVVFFTLVLGTTINTIDGQILVEHVKHSIASANEGKSKLTQEILQLEGMSSSKVRHLLNNLCSLGGASYFEIGVWRGSTFISALYNNTTTLSQAIAMDNWRGQTKLDFFTKTSMYLPQDSFIFFEHNSLFFDPKNIADNSIDIYFYDGLHTAEAQKFAFTRFNSIFADTFVAIVDDWNWVDVRRGTRQAFAELEYTILFEAELPSRFNGDVQNWWNGLYVAVIQKNNIRNN